MVVKVVDASALGAVVFQEAEAEEAWSLFGGDEVYAPTLLLFEMANIARTKILR